MRKKFTALQKEIEDSKDEINSLFQIKKSLHEHIASLEKDIAGLKKEIRERDETIGSTLATLTLTLNPNPNPKP